MGCEFALDDFGSGLCSFSTLETLPMDYLKIDGSFIRNLAADSVNQAMVAGNDRVVAQPATSASWPSRSRIRRLLDAAKSMGIDFVQGFVIARPQPLVGHAQPL